MKRSLMSLAAVSVAICCTYLLGETETDDVNTETEENGNNLEESSNIEIEVNGDFDESVDSDIEEFGLSAEMESGLKKTLQKPENHSTDKSHGGEETSEDETAYPTWWVDGSHPGNPAYEAIAAKWERIAQQNLEDWKEQMRKRMRKNFAKGERALREIYGKDATKDEIIEELVQDLAEEYEEKLKVPSEEWIELAFQYLEELVPELFGISTTWKTTNPKTLFSIVTTSLARHYNTSEEEVAKLESVIKRLIEVVPEDPANHQRLLETDTWHYYRVLLLVHKALRDDVKLLDQDKIELIAIRDKVRSLNENAKTRKIDRFVSCVDDIHRWTDKEFIKLFSSLTRRLEKITATVEKWLEHSDEAVRFERIHTAIGTSIVPHANRIEQIRFRLIQRSCYLNFDVESLKDDYTALLGNPSEN